MAVFSINLTEYSFNTVPVPGKAKSFFGNRKENPDKRVGIAGVFYPADAQGVNKNGPGFFRKEPLYGYFAGKAFLFAKKEPAVHMYKSNGKGAND